MSVSEELGPLRQARLRAGTIAYRETGAGPPVVFVHGVFVNGDLWRKVVPALAPLTGASRRTGRWDRTRSP